MTETQGTLIFADGRRIAGLAVRLEEYPRSWSGTFLVPVEQRQHVIEAFTQRVKCEILLEDGRSGTILLTGLGAMMRFEGTGPLAL